MRLPAHPQLILVLILLAYFTLGTLYALLTPEWQVPDEPAHYNYVRQLATGELPVIEFGDYDAAYQEQLLSTGFPPGYSVDRIQYEDHQPPLYYLLATPVFWAFDGALLPLRLFSVLLGSGVVVLAYQIGNRSFPGRPVVSLTAAALAALVPQHIAMLAGVNNDCLAELLLAAALLGMVCLLRAERPSRPWLLGLLLGAIFVTKIQAYVAAPILGLAIVIRWRERGESTRWLTGWLLGLLVPALAIGVSWWARNLITYGGLDWMGLGRHNAVVAGQPATAHWIAEHGLAATLRRLLQFTFQSFWGMFGWMAVPMDTRVYQGLVVLTCATAFGLGLGLVSRRATSGTMARQPLRRSVPALLALSAVLTGVGFLWYNLTFVQHQGRYLFPAMVPLGLAAGVGWEQLTRTRPARVSAAILFLVAMLLTGWGLLTGDLPLWPIACFGASAAVLLGTSWLPPSARQLLPASVWLALAGLSLASLFLYVLPWL